MNINVNSERVTIEAREPLTSGEYNIHELNFTFSEEYQNLTKKLIAANDDLSYEVDIVDNKATIPYEILETDGDISIGVIGYEVNGNDLVKRYSPAPTYIHVNIGSYKEILNEAEKPKICGVDIDTDADMKNYSNTCTFNYLITKLPSMNLKTNDARKLFGNMVNLKEIGKIKILNATNASNLFLGCTSLQTVDVIWSDKMKIAVSTFESCFSLLSLDLNSCNMQNVTTIASMFGSDNKLKSLKCDKWNLKNCTSANSAFAYCPSLSDDTLHNIVKALLTADKIEDKGIYRLGFSTKQKEKIMSFPEWAELEKKGWH